MRVADVMHDEFGGDSIGRIVDMVVVIVTIVSSTIDAHDAIDNRKGVESMLTMFCEMGN